MTDRKNLPFRKNCEGYFFDKDGRILARKGKGDHIIFPGGGADNKEDIKDAMAREALEEAGAIIKDLRFLGNLRFVWGPDWAKTEKQKRRYLEFQGEDMHFFTGKIDLFIDHDKKEEDFWEGQKTMRITDILNYLESEKPFSKDIKAYRELQLKFLNGLNK